MDRNGFRGEDHIWLFVPDRLETFMHYFYGQLKSLPVHIVSMWANSTFHAGVLAALLTEIIGFQVFLGILISRISSVRKFFDGDNRYWFHFWLLTTATIWAVASVCIVATSSLRIDPIAALGLADWKTWEIVAIVSSVLLFAVVSFFIKDPNHIPSNLSHFAFCFKNKSQRLTWVLFVSTSAAFLEEIVYRGFLLGILSFYFGPWLALFIQGVLFGFHHGGTKQGWKQFSIRSVLGVGFGLLAIWRGGLQYAILVHYLLDAAVILAPVPEKSEQ